MIDNKNIKHKVIHKLDANCYPLSRERYMTEVGKRKVGDVGEKEEEVEEEEEEEEGTRWPE